MKKRKCKRFTIPGTTLYYKRKRFLFSDKEYSQDYFPVLDISKGGASFLTNERIKPGSDIMINLSIPELDSPMEILCKTRWVTKNREESYRFQTGISFNTYGDKKNQNSFEVLEFFKELEIKCITNFSTL